MQASETSVFRAADREAPERFDFEHTRSQVLEQQHKLWPPEPHCPHAETLELPALPIPQYCRIR